MLYLNIGMKNIEEAKNLIDSHIETTRGFFLDMLDEDKQREYEERRLFALKVMLKALYLNKLRLRIRALSDERDEINGGEEHVAEGLCRVLKLDNEIMRLKKKIDSYKPIFAEPYFARMDVYDEREGYNSYYVGRRGDVGLEIIDWRAPLAHKYYQKSRTRFKINDYDYKLVLRRALRTGDGNLVEFKNEYLDLSDYLTSEEIGDGGEGLIFDPFLKEILQSRKEKQEICDIIETIQEKQYEIITLPENEEFVLSGVAGSGKTMVLLHRLSYILYNDESVKPSDVLIITPSDSFNAFIDELSAVLEIERVKTSTIDAYFMRVLKNIGVDLSGKIINNLKLPPEYASFIYSDEFILEVEKKLKKIYDGVFGLFSSSESEEFIRDVDERCVEQLADYEHIKNASVRVRRCVLGEIKEKAEGGLYYTKQFRYLFNGILAVREVFDIVKNDERARDYAYFFKQLLSFYKSVKLVRASYSRVCATAIEDLKRLRAAAVKEVDDLRRYKTIILNKEAFVYAEQISKKEELVKEIDDVLRRVERIFSRFAFISDLFDALRGDVYFSKLGKCESVADILRFFNREILRKIKSRFNADINALYSCDPFALCLILAELGFKLSPRYLYIFVDEAQDISAAEYTVLRMINQRSVINAFGDLKQNVNPLRGLKSWEELQIPKYELDVNYRNTAEIVDFVAREVGISMRPVGLGGADVEFISSRSAAGWLNKKKGLKAIICSNASLASIIRKNYNAVGKTGKISKTKINILTVYESKGLEFTAVAVADGDLSDNEKYVAYTRALKELAIIKD